MNNLDYVDNNIDGFLIECAEQREKAKQMLGEHHAKNRNQSLTRITTIRKIT